MNNPDKLASGSIPASPEREQVRQPTKGDYVLATKYSDGDPADHWCVGFYIGPGLHGRQFVGDENGGPGPNGFRFSGFRCVDFIDKALGEWMVRNAVELEKVPAGSVDLRQICAARMKFLADREPSTSVSTEAQNEAKIMNTEEEYQLAREKKRQKAQGREVKPEDLPVELRLLRLEKMITDLQGKVKYLSTRDAARGLSGIRIGGTR